MEYPGVYQVSGVILLLKLSIGEGSIKALV